MEHSTKAYNINDKEVLQPHPILPPIEPCQGQNLILSPLLAAQDFFDQLYNCSHGSPEKQAVWQYMPYGPFTDVDQMRQTYKKMAVNNDPLFYAVIDKTSNTPTGVVSYLRLSPAAYSIEIGHIWHQTNKQRGIANTESAFLLIDQAMKLGYRRMEWKCNALNDRSCRAALRLGFGFEGIFRQHIVLKSKNRDTAWFSIIDSDWATIRQNFIQWMQSPATQSLTDLNRPLVEWSLPCYKLWKGVKD